MSERGSAERWAVAGQVTAAASLRHALEHDRLAHAYLFTGPAGVGKATLARRLAQALLCEAAAGDGDGPCLECRTCRHVETGDAPDVERVAIGGVCDVGGHPDHATDGSTRIRICQVRRLQRLANLAPFAAARRIFIVDTADELQTEAAHALLKTLEEPPATVLLILLATDGEALLPTIRSRCQQLALRPMPLGELATALAQELDLPAEEAQDLARLARGRYGLALQLHADPSLRVMQETVTADVQRLSRAGRNERFDYAAELARRWRRERESVLATLDIWRASWRDVLLAASDVDAPTAAAARAEATQCSPPQALRSLRATQRARDHLLENTNAQLALEVMMLDLPQLPGLPQSQEQQEQQEQEARAAAPSPSQVHPGREAAAAAGTA